MHDLSSIITAHYTTICIIMSAICFVRKIYRGCNRSKFSFCDLKVKLGSIFNILLKTWIYFNVLRISDKFAERGPSYLSEFSLFQLFFTRLKWSQKTEKSFRLISNFLISTNLFLKTFKIRFIIWYNHPMVPVASPGFFSGGGERPGHLKAIKRPPQGVRGAKAPGR